MNFLETESSEHVHVSQKECYFSVTLVDEGHTKVASFLSKTAYFMSKTASYKVQFSKKLAKGYSILSHRGEAKDVTKENEPVGALPIADYSNSCPSCNPLPHTEVKNCFLKLCNFTIKNLFLFF